MEKTRLVENDNQEIKMTQRYKLLNLSRSSYYYISTIDDEYNLHLMRLINEQYTKVPFYGANRMTAWLRAERHEVKPKRVRRLVREMALDAIYLCRRISFSSPGHKFYAYLLRAVKIERPDQIWVADIACFRLAHGFLYLVLVMNWGSCYVLSWELSNTLDSRFCH